MADLRNMFDHRNLRNSLSLLTFLFLLKNRKGSLKSTRSLDRSALLPNNSKFKSFKVESGEVAAPRFTDFNCLKQIYDFLYSGREVAGTPDALERLILFNWNLSGSEPLSNNFL